MGIPTTPAYIVVATPARSRHQGWARSSSPTCSCSTMRSCPSSPRPCALRPSRGCHRRKQAMETGFIALKLGIVAFIAPLHVRLSASAPRHRGERLKSSGRHRLPSASSASRAVCRAGFCVDLRMGTRLPAHRRADAHLSRPLHRHHRLRAPSVGIVQMFAAGEHPSPPGRITSPAGAPFLRAVDRHLRPQEGCFSPTIISHKQLQSFKMIIDFRMRPGTGFPEHRRLRRRGLHRKSSPNAFP